MDSTAAPAELTQITASRSEENKTSNHLISAFGVAKSFSGVPALLDGRIELRRGSVHALCGGNGAGKSTFLNILMSLLRPDAGTITARAGSCATCLRATQSTMGSQSSRRSSLPYST